MSAVPVFGTVILYTIIIMIFMFLVWMLDRWIGGDQ